MNDIEKAIETLKDMRSYFNDRSHRQYSMPAIDTAISALEKQIAKKPMRMNKDVLCCPSCNLPNVYKEENYCLECGQKLDWKE